MNSVLVDSSFLYALIDYSDKYHRTAALFAESGRNTLRIVPDVVLTEVAYLLQQSGDFAVLKFMDLMVVGDYQLEAITTPDLQRACEIKATYATARLDFVDCCLIAISERLKIMQVCTFDRRDFSIFRPKHVDYLDLLP